MNDWTQDETGRSNSSKLFKEFELDIARVIKNCAYDLLDGRADIAAGIILANLAHGGYHFAPGDRAQQLEDCLRWLTNLAHGVSKGGGNPDLNEWEAAWDKAKELLNG